MDFIAYTDDKELLWNEFCLKSDDIWYWHTRPWLGYCLLYGKEKFKSRELSFMVMDDTGVLAVCPLLLEKVVQPDGTDYYEFYTSGSGGPGIAPALRNDLNEDRHEKILKVMFERVDALAKEYGVVKAGFRTTPLSNRGCVYNELMKYGYLDSSLNTRLIDLSSTLERLWSAFRKGHKYDTKRGEKTYQIHIYDQTNADKDAFEQYRLLHHKTAGRITRPIETFEMMYRWMLAGEAMLCGVSRDGQFAGFSYILLYKGAAFYASASDDPDFETDIPISHVIQWKIINWLKENGFKTYEIGTQQFGPQLHDLPSPKDQSISFFKRGFGGRTLPVFRGFKYYDKDFMKRELGNNLQNLIDRYQV